MMNVIRVHGLNYAEQVAKEEEHQIIKTCIVMSIKHFLVMLMNDLKSLQE